MKFADKLKVRLYAACAIALIGIGLILTGVFTKTEMASSFGLMFFVVGIARIIQYKRITKNEGTLHKREVAETDERNVMLWTRARSMTFSVYVLLSAAAVVLLYLSGASQAARIVSYTLWSIVVIYWICYFIISRKY